MCYAGFSVFLIGMIPSVPTLIEGVTGLVGEGSRLSRESAEQIQGRLTVVGMLWTAAILAWVLVRVGTALCDPGSQAPLGMARLAAEVLWFAGALGLALAALVGLTPRAAGYETPQEYRRLLPLGGIMGPILLAAGWGVWWLWGRRCRPAVPARPSC
jgi:hypothetical protein